MRMRFAGRVSVGLSVLVVAASLAPAQEGAPPLAIGRTASAARQTTQVTPVAELDKLSAFKRVLSISSAKAVKKSLRADGAATRRVSKFVASFSAAAAPEALSVGTGGGDINEIEPNDPLAQGVSLPVNIFGTVRFNSDVISSRSRRLPGSG